jgi:uncharacterized membrane protein
LVVAAVLAVGCEPKCREVESISEIRAQTLERFEDRFDDADVADAKRPRLQGLIIGTMPRIAKLREETLPRQRQVIAELKRPEPDRARIGALIGKNVDAGNAYMHELIDVLMQAHAVLSPEERARLARDASEPSEGFEGSWLLDRAVDYFLSRIDATPEQRKLVEKMKRDLIARGKVLQRKVDALRREAAQEFAKDKPDVAKMHAALDRGRDLTRTALYDLAGYYLLLASKLDARQRQLLNAELVRFEPCPRAGPGHQT